MKLIIQIPCFNEEKTLPVTFLDLPKSIPGIDSIETLIIDDGSTDRTIDVAKMIGVTHIIRHTGNKGLARAFETGIEACVRLGADIIVNTDGDNQYSGGDIETLVRPILDGEAEMVVGDRQTDTIDEFSYLKKKLQKHGSGLIRRLSNTPVRDTVSGFRAFTRDVALRIHILSGFSYTIENLIQLGNNNVKIVSVPIRTNAKLRESRLFKGIGHFLASQGTIIVRIYSTYKALRVFSLLGFLMLLPGVWAFARFLYFYFKGDGQGHIQSLIFGTTFIIIGFLVLVVGILADLISNNRKLIEKVLYTLKQSEWKT